MSEPQAHEDGLVVLHGPLSLRLAEPHMLLVSGRVECRLNGAATRHGVIYGLQRVGLLCGGSLRDGGCGGVANGRAFLRNGGAKKSDARRPQRRQPGDGSGDVSVDVPRS